MSGIAVIHHLDGRPVDPKIMVRMLDTIAHRAVDGCDTWLNGPSRSGTRRFVLHPNPRASINLIATVQERRRYAWCWTAALITVQNFALP